MIELAKSLLPVHPEDGSVVSDPSPEIRWEALSGLPEGYTIIEYVLSIDDDYTLDVRIEGLQEPSWKVPVPIRSGAHMRWIASAIVATPSGNQLRLGRVERAATFTVEYPVTAEASGPPIPSSH